MRSASEAFANKKHDLKALKALTSGVSIPDELRQVALTFVELQNARCEADYNVGQTFTRIEANDLVMRVEQAFEAWDVIREDPAAQLYLAALMIWKKWKRGASR